MVFFCHSSCAFNQVFLLLFTKAAGLCGFCLNAINACMVYGQLVELFLNTAFNLSSSCSLYASVSAFT